MVAEAVKRNKKCRGFRQVVCGHFSMAWTAQLPAAFFFRISSTDTSIVTLTAEVVCILAGAP